MFRTLLASQWESLSPAVRKHYGIRDGESVILQGELAVKHGRFIKLLMPLIRLTGALVPVEGDNFSVTVENRRVGDTFYWHREFRQDNKVYEFNSKMQQYCNDIVEFVGLGIGIRMGVSVLDGGLAYQDRGYVFKLGSLLIPIPLGLLMGKSEITEYAKNENVNDLDMTFVVNHPVFGFAFSYMGFFNIRELNIRS